jgi:hypothetical protein
MVGVGEFEQFDGRAVFDYERDADAVGWAVGRNQDCRVCESHIAPFLCPHSHNAMAMTQGGHICGHKTVRLPWYVRGRYYATTFFRVNYLAWFLDMVGLFWREAMLLSDAEGAEDQVEDVVGGGGAGDFVEGAEGVVEIEEEHFVGDAGGDGVAGVG